MQVGETVDVGTVMARIATDARPGEAHVSENENGIPETGTGEATAALEAPGEAGELQGDTETVQRPVRRAGGRRYSPVVMRIAAEHDVDLELIEGTGRDGRVRKQDVLAYVESGPKEEPPMHIESPYRPDEPVAPKQRKPRLSRVEEVSRPAAPAAAPAATGAGKPLSRMRQAIGSRMVQSLQTAATCTTIVEADMTRIVAARQKSGLSFLPYQARAAIETLLQFPALNATLEDDIHTLHEGVHLGIAVSLGEGGLIVPVIRDAQDLSVEGLAKRIKDIAKRARTNALTPDEVSGGTFTITNPGGYGSLMATPVINLPQVAILDTEAIVKRPVVVTDELGNDSIAIRHMTYLCMGWDHRALDGALAAQFLTALRKKLEAWPIS